MGFRMKQTGVIRHWLAGISLAVIMGFPFMQLQAGFDPEFRLELSVARGFGGNPPSIDYRLFWNPDYSFPEYQLQYRPGNGRWQAFHATVSGHNFPLIPLDFASGRDFRLVKWALLPEQGFGPSPVYGAISSAYHLPVTVDNDADGYPDPFDAFPDDDREWADSDSDGVGDNADTFPDDPAEWADADQDGVGDNTDVFPHDPYEWADTGGDGIGDNTWQQLNADSDGDGVPDIVDGLPDDAGSSVHPAIAVESRFEVTDSGSASMIVPVQTFAGTAGAVPRLSLGYDSGSGNGYLGLGWGVTGLSQVARCQRTHYQDGLVQPVKYNSNDRFCLDGHRLVAVAGEYGIGGTTYRTEIDTYQTISSHGWVDGGPEYFRVVGKDGSITYYGQSASARKRAGGVTALWAISRREDRMGNPVRYHYRGGVNNFRIDRIDYAFGDNRAADYSSTYIEFVYESRPDFQTGYANGQPWRHDRRLAAIHSYNDGLLLAEYKLSYVDDEAGHFSRLGKIEQCRQEVCHQPLLMQWPPVAQGYQLTVDKTIAAPSLQGADRSMGHVPADINGDGRHDLIYSFEHWDEWDQYYLGFALSDGSELVKSEFETKIGSGYANPPKWGVLDFNFDGRADVLLCAGRESCKVYLGSEQGLSETHVKPVPGLTIPGYGGLSLADIDGDGLTDFIYTIVEAGAGPSRLLGVRYGQRSVNPQTGQWEHTFADDTVTISVEENFSHLHIGNRAVARLVDINGDGLVDLAGNIEGELVFYVNNGTRSGRPFRHYASTGIEIRELKRKVSFSLVDANGDGLLDVLWANGSGLWLSFNTGQGFAQAIAQNTFTAEQIDNMLPLSGLAWFDVNQDGFPDMYSSEEGIFQFDPGSNQFHYVWPSLSDAKGQLLMDVTGDGKMDWVSFGGDAQAIKHQIWTSRNDGEVTDKVVSFDNSLGKIIGVDYRPLSDAAVYTKYGDAAAVEWAGLSDGQEKTYPIHDFIGTHQVVAAVRIPTTVTESMESTLRLTALTTVEAQYRYHYEGGRYQQGGVGWLGFARRTQQQEGLPLVTAYSYRQDYPLNGRLHLLQREIGPEQPESRQRFAYRVIARPGSSPRFQVYSTGQEQLSYALPESMQQNSSLLSTEWQTTERDSWGNLTSETTEIYPVNASAPAKRIQRQYSYSNARFGLMAAETISMEVPQAPLVQRTTHYQHGSNGLLTEKIVEPADNDLGLRYAFDYDGFGNATLETIEPLNGSLPARSVRRVYDHSGRYLDQRFNALGQLVEQIEARNEYGQPTRIASGLNQRVITVSHDVLGREVMRSDNTGWFSATRYGGNEAVPHAATSVWSTRSDAPPQAEHFDALGRSVATTHFRYSQGELYPEHQYTFYDQFGRIDREPTLPCPVELLNCGGFTKRYTYHPVSGRVQQISDTEGITRFTHAGLTTVTTNALWQRRTTRRNVLGLVVEREDAEGSVVRYRYAADDQLREVSFVHDASAAQTQTLIEYDQLGRKTRTIENENGTTFYRYNPFGELAEQVQVTSVVRYHGLLEQLSASDYKRTVLSYDLLGRRIAQHEYAPGNQLEGSSQWSYVAQGNGQGQLAQVSGGGLTRQYQYDAWGRLQEEVWEDGTPALAAMRWLYTYDGLGRLSSRWDDRHGNGEYYAYLPTAETGTIIDMATGQMMYQLLARNAQGGVTQQKFGPLNLTKQYYFNTGWLRSVVAEDTLELAYQYDKLGNVTSQAIRRLDEARPVVEQSYCYDALNRLIKTHHGTLAGNCSMSGAEQDQEYGNFGEIVRKQGVGIYRYQRLPRHEGISFAVTATGQNDQFIEYHYDSNGNMLMDGTGRIIRYTVFNKPEQIQRPGIEVSFDYDADNQRWRRVDTDVSGTVTTYYLGNVEKIIRPDGSFEIKRYIAGNVLWSHYYDASGARLDADGDGNTDEHVLKQAMLIDRIGSMVALVDLTTGVVTDYRFSAWGERVDAGDGLSVLNSLLFRPVDLQPTTRGFSAHEMVDGLDIIHMNGRIYDPRLGRFLQSDPFVPDPTNTQSFNRYSYVRNNPFTRVDPTGYVDYDCQTGPCEMEYVEVRASRIEYGITLTDLTGLWGVDPQGGIDYGLDLGFLAAGANNPFSISLLSIDADFVDKVNSAKKQLKKYQRRADRINASGGFTVNLSSPLSRQTRDTLALVASVQKELTSYMESEFRKAFDENGNLITRTIFSDSWEPLLGGGTLLEKMITSGVSFPVKYTILN